MDTAFIVAIGVLLLLSSKARADVFTAIGAALQSAGQDLAGAVAGEVPYGGSAGEIPNSSGFNDAGGLEIQYLGSSYVQDPEAPTSKLRRFAVPGESSSVGGSLGTSVAPVSNLRTYQVN